MRSTQLRILALLTVFAVALGGALLVLQSRGDDAGSRSTGADRAASSEIWAEGDTWTVKVRQDAGAISPGGEESVAEIPFRFTVAEAPADADGAWLVRVKQDGAEGPFAAGWRMEYREEGDEMVLARVAVGSEPWLEAELATIAFGVQFPYEPRYSAPPKDETVDGKELLERSQLPPGELPDGAPAAPSGATPPAEAPKVTPGGAPDIA